MGWPWSKKKKSSPKPVEPVEPEKDENGKFIGEWKKQYDNDGRNTTTSLDFIGKNGKIIKGYYFQDDRNYYYDNYGNDLQKYPPIPESLFTSKNVKEENKRLSAEDDKREDEARELAENEFEKIIAIIKNINDDKPRKYRNSYTNLSAKSILKDKLLDTVCRGVGYRGGSHRRSIKKDAKRRTRRS